MEYKGIVQFYKKGKGIGFIREIGGTSRADDVFVHHTDVELAGLKTLKPDQHVEYDVGEYDRIVIKQDPDDPTKTIQEEIKDLKAINLKITD